MINKIKDWFKKSDNEKSDPLPKDIKRQFSLFYKDKIIGYLEVENGKWKFYYSEEFKKNPDIDYITGFPDLNKVYISEILWPFFKIRIPGLGQPRIQKTLENENISEKDEIALLKRFGEKTISNPFILNPTF